MIATPSTRLPGLLLATLLGACGNDDPTSAPLAAAVTITPGQPSFVALGLKQQLSAVATDAHGASLPGKPIFWISLAPGVASVDSTGLVTALANGSAEILAVVDGIAGSADVTVAQVITTIAVVPDSVAIVGIGSGSPPLDAVARDGNDSTIAGVAFTWSAADTDVVVIDPVSGIATARGLGMTTVSAASGGVTSPATVIVDAHYYVNAVTGNDANPGTTTAAPFKSITHALSVAAAGNTIKVLPGEYSVLNGETFPLTGPAGLRLIGDEANKGGGLTPTTVIRRAGDMPGGRLFEPPAGALIAGFTVTLDFAFVDNPGVSVSADSIVIRNNRITGGFAVGLLAAPPSIGVIRGNVFSGGGEGLFCGGSGLRIERNTFIGNTVGMTDAVGCGADLGGGSGGSLGANVFSCNSFADVRISRPGATLMAAGNQWDHVPPTLYTENSSIPPGTDVLAQNGATVVTTGATLAPSPCP